MAIFPRKNPPPVQIPLINEIASRTLDWSRAVRVEDMEKAYNVTWNGTYVNDVGEGARFGNRFRLLVHGAIFTHQKTTGSSSIAIVVCNTTGDKLYTATGTTAAGSVFSGFITPIIKANSLVVATKLAYGYADIVNFYMVFVPTLSSVGITGLKQFLEYVDKFAPLDNIGSKAAVPSDSML